MAIAKTINDAEEEANLRINSAYVTIPGKYVTIVQNSIVKEAKDKIEKLRNSINNRLNKFVYEGYNLKKDLQFYKKQCIIEKI